MQVLGVTLDLTVGDAEVISLSGPSGSGKTLLLRAIADLIPHAGRVRLDDRWCDEMPAHEWRRQVGLLPTESQWWRDRVGEHFNEAEIESSWFEQLGFSMDVLNWQLARCSTGEKQRLAILRLLCQRPKALLLDEPTASLDPGSVSRVETLLQNYVRDAAAPAIWVSHDPQQQQRLTRRRFMIRDERVVEERL